MAGQFRQRDVIIITVLVLCGIGLILLPLLFLYGWLHRLITGESIISSEEPDPEVPGSGESPTRNERDEARNRLIAKGIVQSERWERADQ